MDIYSLQTGYFEAQDSKGNLLDDYITLGMGHYIFRSNGPAVLALLPLKTNQDTGEVLRCFQVNPQLIVVPPEKCNARFFCHNVSALEVRTKDDVDWHFIKINSSEKPDPTPVEIPLGMDKPLTIRDEMRRFIREEISNKAMYEKGAESFEESNDLEVDDDSEIDFGPTQYEMVDDNEFEDYTVSSNQQKEKTNADPKKAPDDPKDKNESDRQKSSPDKETKSGSVNADE